MCIRDRTDPRPSTSSAPQQAPPKPQNKPVEYKGKPRFNRQKPISKGNDGTPMRAIQTVAVSGTGTTAQTSEIENVRDPIAKVKQYPHTKNVQQGAPKKDAQ